MHRILLIGALAWTPATAMAQHVYKCVSGGQTSYQSSPCSDGSAPVRTWDHGSYAPPAPQPMPASRTSRPRATSQVVGTVHHERTRARTPDRSPGRCESARRQREFTLQAERIGKRSMKLRRKLDAMVVKACGTG